MKFVANQHILSQEDAKLFTTQFMRRTGDTLMAKAGVTQQDRAGAGCWRARTSEEGYNSLTPQERAAVTAAATVGLW